MKLLPHFFKWIGLAIFFIGFTVTAIDDGRQDFLDGYYSAAEYCEKPEMITIQRVFPEKTMHISDIASLVGLLLYILAKNKREDEFFRQLRYESAFLVMVLSIVIILVIYIFNRGFKLGASDFLSLQMIGYLIVRALKRKIILSGNYDEEQA